MNQAAAAFAAGLVSFATPCVLPLVPAYLSAIGASSTDSSRALRAAAPFVVGFSAVFIALGVAVGLAGSVVTDHRLDLIHLGGIVIVAMGFVMMGLLRVPVLERSLTPGVEPARASGSALLLGGAFGLCWTPCVGPVLGSILALAATEATAARGAGLLAAYAAGLAIPFLAVALGLGQAMSAARFLRDRYTTVRIVSGLILVAAGLLVFFDKAYVVNAWVAGISG
ncbi:MAG TPA: cytochrome c biogenesis protein CcdA [Gaiellales bacterium]|nr:cytochrome c biogenesis protein CcdA [Gaiellales bacterium]